MRCSVTKRALLRPDCAYEKKLRCQFGKTVTRERFEVVGTILP
jgi:hypothetical protein